MKENLISKFLKFSYGSWIGLILGLITTMITTRILPPDVLGQVSMFELFLQMGLILTIFGTDQSFIRFYYEEEENKRGALMYNSLKLPMKTSVLLILTIILFYKPITFFLVGAPDFSLAILLVLGIIFQLIFRYGQLVIRMEQKGNVYSLLQILQKLFNLCFIVGLYYFIGSEYEVLVLSKIFTLFLLFILSIYLGRKFWNLKNFYISDTRHSQMEIVKYGAPFVLTIFITWIFQSFDQVAIRHWRDFSELGLYAAAMRIVALVVVLSSTFTTFWTPVSYEKFIADPEDKAFFKNITIVVSFVMFLFAILTIAGKYLIVNLLGQQYLDAANIMPFLVFMPILMTISETTVIGINFYKKTKWHVIIALITCVLNIIGNIVLVPEYGALGASIATAFSFIVFFSLRTYISLRYFKVDYPLKKIYTMVVVVSAYSFFSIYSSSWLTSMLMSLIPLLILFIIFAQDIKNIIKILNLKKK